MIAPCQHIARTALMIAGLLLASPAASAATDPPGPSDGALTLATCHGRYTAVMEHARLMGDGADAAAFRRDLLEAMMNAYLAEHAEDRAYSITMMSHRINARAQLRSLFATAAFNGDTRRRRLATGGILRQIAACDSLVIGRRFTGL